MLHCRLFAILLATLFCLNAQGKTQSIESEEIKITSGNIMGFYYPAAREICGEIAKIKPGTKCSVYSNSGSLSTIDELWTNKRNIAIIQSNIANDAYSSQNNFSLYSPFRELRSIATLTEDQLLIAVRKDSTFQNLDSLRYKKVSYGSDESGAKSLLEVLTRAKGWHPRDLDVVKLSTHEFAEDLCNGSVDAVVMAISHPNAIMKDIAKSCDIRFVSLNNKEQEQSSKLDSNITKTVIKKTEYNTDADISTIGVAARLYTTKKMSSELAYLITKAVVQHLKNRGVKSAAEYSSLLHQNIPIHHGALLYYRDDSTPQ